MNQITTYIGLGNLGDREGLIKKAIALLADVNGITAVRASTIVETAPLGGLDQPRYLNAVAEVRTSLNASELLGYLHQIENGLGRIRQGAMSSRTIDLDLLLFGQEVIKESNLTVPHPDVHLRSFVLNGLKELNPALVHPTLKRTIIELSSRLNGGSFLINPDVPQLISVAGIIGVGKTTLAKGLAENLRAKLLLEAYDTNPFLAKVYAGRKELALDSQLYFLLSRLDQTGKAVLNSGQIAVSDYLFDTEMIYAKRLLDPQQQSLYFKINTLVTEKICPPALAIYIKDTPQKCLYRIHKRNRPYEQSISVEFLQTQCSDYEELVRNWTQCPLITVMASEFDCRDSKQVAKLSEEIKAYIAIKK